MIKALIFDFSGVCSSNEEPDFVRRFAQQHHLPIEEFEQAYINLIHQAERDEMTGMQVWEKLSKKYRLKINIPKTIKDMMDQKEYYQDMLSFTQSLRKKYNIGVFSNYNQYYWELIVKKINLHPYFDSILVSYQVQARKDAAPGFHWFLKQFSTKPEETVVIDDSEKNLAIPKQLGFHAILFRNKEQLIKEKKRLGITFK